MDPLVASLNTTARQVLVVAGPLALMAVLLYAVERLLAARLVSRFGWRGVLMTGWLGVPVHELSHAGACLLFGHRVERLRLFAPDPRTGRLGGVQHAWSRRNPYHQVGRFFIGVAPLAGGTLVLWWLSWVFGTLAAVPLDPPPLAPGAGAAALLAAAAGEARELVASLLRPDVYGNGWTWLYLYLCLCVGAHIAPSAADLRGSLPGLLLLLVLLLLVNLWAGWSGTATGAGEQLALELSAPVLALLVLAFVLGALCLALVTLVTAVLPRRSS